MNRVVQGTLGRPSREHRAGRGSCSARRRGTACP